MSDDEDYKEACREDYRRSFGLDGSPGTRKTNVELTKAALEKALENRKFEIGLYWQRAAYFWALIGVAFAGYFAILSANDTYLRDKDYLAYIIRACSH